MSLLCPVTVWGVMANIHHSLPKLEIREMSLPHLWCHTDVQLHRELLKNDGSHWMGVSSNTRDIFQANVRGMHKVSLPFIINGAAPGCKSEWHHRWKARVLKFELWTDRIYVRFRYLLSPLQTLQRHAAVVYSMPQFPHFHTERFLLTSTGEEYMTHIRITVMHTLNFC